MPDVVLSMVLLGVGGVLLMCAAAYTDIKEWKERRRDN